MASREASPQAIADYRETVRHEYVPPPSCSKRVMTRISVEVPYFYSTDSKVGVDCFCMFFYLFGIGVCVLLPVAAYLLLGRRKQPIERQQLQPTVRRNTDGQRRERQLGRAVLEEERVMTSPTRGNTPRHLSFR